MEPANQKQQQSIGTHHTRPLWTIALQFGIPRLTKHDHTKLVFDTAEQEEGKFGSFLARVSSASDSNINAQINNKFVLWCY